MVVHAKSRSGGRSATDNRREGAARDLVEALEQKYDDANVVIVGDFNDNPDDRSLNILEMGDPNAPAGPEQIDGPFLINVTEPLVVDDRVSWGLRTTNIVDGQINTQVPGSRQVNNATRGTSGQIHPILFDQILISSSLVDEYEVGSAAVFSQAVALEGTSQESRASDHVPVSASYAQRRDRQWGWRWRSTARASRAAPVQIVSLLPNPEGEDAGNEWVTIKNVSMDPVEPDRWQLRDRAGHTVSPSGTIAAGTASLNRCSGARLTTGPGGLRTRKLVPLSRYWYLSSPEVWHDSSGLARLPIPPQSPSQNVTRQQLLSSALPTPGALRSRKGLGAGPIYHGRVSDGNIPLP